MTTLLMYLQAAAQTTVQTVAAVSPSDSVPATLGAGVVVAIMLQALKNASWFPWLSRNTATLNFWVGIVAAVASTAGVHVAYDASAGGTITLPGVNAIVQAVVQWATQQAAYKGLVVPAETLGEIRTMLERYATPPPVSEGAAKADEETPHA